MPVLEAKPEHSHHDHQKRRQRPSEIGTDHQEEQVEGPVNVTALSATTVLRSSCVRMPNPTKMQLGKSVRLWLSSDQSEPKFNVPCKAAWMRGIRVQSSSYGTLNQ